MGTFNVSLKTLTKRVSMEVVYTPRELDQINVEIAEVNRPGLFLSCPGSRQKSGMRHWTSCSDSSPRRSSSAAARS